MTKMGLATFWANSLQTHLVTLFAANKQNFISGRFGKKNCHSMTSKALIV
jgi:hypothetical protein